MMIRTAIIATAALVVCVATTFSCAGDSDVESVVDKNGEDAAVTKISEVNEEGAIETDIVESDVAETEAEVEVTENTGAVCPECGSANVIPIIYGKPGQELVERAERGEVKLGGCVISRESPFNYCKDCKAEW